MTNTLPHAILVHGLGRHPASLRRVARFLRGQGFGVTNWAYASRVHTLDQAADQLGTAYAALARTNATVHFVTHSMGGIVLRRLLARAPLPQLGKIVMLAPPNNGSLVARRMLAHPIINAVLGPGAYELADGAVLNATCAVPQTPVLVVAGTKARDARNPVSFFSARILHEPSDGTVAVRETRLPRMDHFVEVAACHTWIMNHPDTLDAIGRFFGEAIPTGGSMQIDLRQATLDDVAFLVEVVIAATIAQGRFPRDVAQAEYRAGYAEWTRETVLGSVPNCTLSVIQRDGEPIGRLRVLRDGTSITLAGIQLLPAWQNQGIGSELLGRLKREAAAQRVPLRLSVEKDNPHAQRFYQRLGFVGVGEDAQAFQLEHRPT